MNTRRPVLIIAAVLFAATAVAQNDATQAPAAPTTAAARPITYPWMAAGLIERGVPVIDVRSAEEVAETGTIADAENIPHTELDALAAAIGEDRSRTVVLYCGSGRRVGLVIDALRDRGYYGLVNGGGFAELSEAIDQR